MSHSSGIPVSSKLKDAFGNLISSPNVRLVKVQIDNEEMVPITSKNQQSNWEQDLSMLPDLLEKEKPCFVIYRIENDTSTSRFALFCYVPDKSKVKEKMLYASSRSNLKQQLGMNYFADEVFGTVLDDFSLKGYKHHIESKKSEAPLTEQEMLKKQEVSSVGEVYTGGSTTYVHGVAFPVEKTVVDATKKLVTGGLSYVQVAIDCDNEKIICDHSGNADFAGLANKIRIDEPRFHFFAYKHNHEGQKQTAIVYIYSCPDGSNGTKSAPVRMRMLYSSSKANVAEIITQAGGSIQARLEINTPADLNEDTLVALLHPAKEAKEQSFSKPSKPGKGARKLIRDKK